MDTSANPLRTVIFIGRPGSGKGTQAKKLAERLGWATFSSGTVLKELIDAGGPLSESIRRDYENGRLLPDWFVEHLFDGAVLNLSGEQGIVIDGFPRTLVQGEFVNKVFAWLGRSYKVLLLEVSEDEALRRQLGRAKVESRPDSDDEAKIRNRFAVYTKQTEPLLEFFKSQGALIEIDGEQTPEKIAEDIRAALNA